MSDAAVRDRSGRFVDGHPLVGSGRPVGARTKLGEAYCVDLLDVWQRKGKAGLELVADENPAVFARLVARVLPAQLQADVQMSALDGATPGALETFAELARFVSRFPQLVPRLMALAERAERGEVVTIDGVTVKPIDAPKTEPRPAWPDVSAEVQDRLGSGFRECVLGSGDEQ